MVYRKHNQRGFSLVEILVTASILLLVFGGFFLGYKYSLELITISRSKLTALTLMNSKMEYIQSLSYNAVGTQGGIPAGAILQTSTTTLNKIEFGERVLIEYVDDPADGVGGADSNGITTDYKRVKIEYSWEAAGIPQTMFLVSNIVPRSIESDVGGGTLRVNVFDAGVVPLPGAQVRLVNNTLTPAIDTTRFSDASGIALFGGAPAASEYEIFVTRAGYSADQTHRATTTNPNPTTLPVTVLEADVTTMNFFIDELSDVLVRAFASKTTGAATEEFVDASGIATSTAVAVSSNALRLADTSGTYSATGTAFLSPVAPSPLAEWSRVTVLGNELTDTTARWSLYEPTVPPTLVPDSEIPGNSAGYTFGTIDISTLSASTYPSLQIGLSLATASSTQTPTVDTVEVAYIADAVPRASQAITFTSQKSIGTDASSTPVAKHNYTATTDGSGEALLTGVEWDSYSIQANPYIIAEACPNVPHIVPPGTSTQLDLVLVAASPHTLRVVVEAGGASLTDASVTLSRPGYSETLTTSQCGQVFFNSLNNNSDYTIEVSAAGYPTNTINPFSIDGTMVEVITL